MRATHGLLLLQLLLLSLTDENVIGGPVPSRPIVDVRSDLTTNPTVDVRLHSNSDRFGSLDNDLDPLMGYAIGSPHELTGASIDRSYDLEFIGPDTDLTLGTSNEADIRPRLVTSLVKGTEQAAKGAQKGVNAKNKAAPPQTQSKLEKDGKIIENVGKGLTKAASALDAAGPLGEIAATALQVIGTFLEILGAVLNAAAEAERKSDEARGKFTRETIGRTLKKHPGWNVIVVGTNQAHSTYFQGSEHTDWSHDKGHINTGKGHFEYDVYASRAGVFFLQGDGGFQNWAYSATAQVHSFGNQNHRLILTGPPPKNHPKSGTCKIHIYQYQKGSSENSDKAHFAITAIIYDAGGMIVGFVGDGNLGHEISAASQLPKVINISAGKVDNDPLNIGYGGDKFDTNTVVKVKGKPDVHRCSVGGYDSGSRQMDCNFGCTFK